MILKSFLSSKKIIFSALVLLIFIVAAAVIIGTTSSQDTTNAANVRKKVNANQLEINKKFLTKKEGEFFVGKEDATIVVVDYGSFSCPHCAAFYDSVFPELKKKYIDGGKVIFIHRSFPLNVSALRATQLVECVSRNADTFYNLTQVLYKTQASWAFAKDFAEQLKSVAKLAGISESTFDSCLANKDLENKILKDQMEATDKLGIDSTPAIFINNVKNLDGNSFDIISKKIEQILMAK